MRARMWREDLRLVGMLLVVGLTTLALPHPGRLLLTGRSVPADADEALAGLLLAALGGGFFVRSKRSRDSHSAR